ncbi:MAG TPA: serine kinase, partial [Firmicutes bacterium]|nr:serine kinase [Bacillota bacterium]
CVVVVGGIKPGSDVIERANGEGIPILLTDLPAFEVVGRCYELGIRGGQRR